MRTSSQDGSVLVESALSIMIFLLLILGIIEAGRIFQVQNVLTNAAREGARLAVTPLSGTDTLATTEQITAKINSFLTAGSIDAQTAVITVNQAVTFPPDPTTYSQVTVTFPYTVLTIAMFRNLEINLTGTSLMRNETSP